MLKIGHDVTNFYFTEPAWRLLQHNLASADLLFDHLVGNGDQPWREGEPDDLATLRLVSNSNLADCTTGSSVGCAPRKILPLPRRRLVGSCTLGIGVCGCHMSNQGPQGYSRELFSSSPRQVTSAICGVRANMEGVKQAG